jgi:hypothetical protein
MNVEIKENKLYFTRFPGWRSLLLYQGTAYALRHGIRNVAADRVSALCANAAGAGVEVGDVVGPCS